MTKNLLVILLIIGVAYGSSLADDVANTYSSVTGSSSDGSGGYRDDYGGKKCHQTYETKYSEKCEDYQEKVCYTTQKERCEDVMGQKCEAIKSSKDETKCYDVTEQLCSLKEDVQLEEIPALSTVQKCHNIKEPVCDTVYETEIASKDDFKCIKVTNPYCTKKVQTVYDKTCRNLVHFDCKAHAYGTYGSLVVASHDTKGYGGIDYALEVDSSDSEEYDSSASEEYDNSASEGYDSSASNEYDSSAENVPQYKCSRNYETKCYTTPRFVSVEHCEDREEEVCEKLTEKLPVPTQYQNCHDEHKQVCELEQTSQPMQMKKYVYTKQCRPVPKTVCDHADQMFLQPSCVQSSRKVCSYHPEEKCENVPKQHCHKIPYQVQKMECSEDYGSEGGYEEKFDDVQEVYSSVEQ